MTYAAHIMNLISGQKTTKLFCDLLDDFVMDVTLEAHAEVSKSRAICETCGTRYAYSRYLWRVLTHYE